MPLTWRTALNGHGDYARRRDREATRRRLRATLHDQRDLDVPGHDSFNGSEAGPCAVDFKRDGMLAPVA